jgi:hypothetical protein
VVNLLRRQTLVQYCTHNKMADNSRQHHDLHTDCKDCGFGAACFAVSHAPEDTCLSSVSRTNRSKDCGFGAACFAVSHAPEDTCLLFVSRTNRSKDCRFGAACFAECPMLQRIHAYLLCRGLTEARTVGSEPRVSLCVPRSRQHMPVFCVED